ncbi:MAG: hypothetical protein MPI95_02110 [Nitrosopumilus sp.]|nr:hypothetical protein [Nitrosopumilus sp.]CAI9831113.1 exported hypothetical protein [Nitrosopumilaceae archaeon]MDA7941199.1 hypothetical protein [Nitrosopumilus sp.]MDA7942402.1 hypothetical protein [Nitrosopumilus sp.]MDA7944876.1 hypothetical protein [Nitrosopumilus sp.]
MARMMATGSRHGGALRAALLAGVSAALLAASAAHAVPAGQDAAPGTLGGKDPGQASLYFEWFVGGRSGIERATYLDSIGAYDLAARSYERTLKWDVQHMLARWLDGMLWTSLAAGVEGARLDAQLLEHPGNHFLLAAKAHALHKSGDAGAAAMYEAALDVEPRSATALLGRADILGEAGMHEERAGVLGGMAAGIRGNAAVLGGWAAALGAGHATAPEYHDAAEEMSRAASLISLDAAAALHRAGNDAGAQEHLEAALEADPGNLLALANRAAGLHRAGMHAEALGAADVLRDHVLREHARLEYLPGADRGETDLLKGRFADHARPRGPEGAAAYLGAVLEGYPAYEERHAWHGIGAPYYFN